MPRQRLRLAPRSCKAWLLAVLTAGLLTGAAVAEAPAAGTAARVRRAQDTFASGGERITVERFEPAAPGKYPAVLLLHSLDGLDTPCGAVYRLAATECAARGYVVLLVHYSDRTATGPKQLPAVREPFLRWAKGGRIKDADRQTIAAHFRAWTEAVEDAVRYARGRPNVDGTRVGLVGFSLGAFLALSVAADEDQKIAAVVDFFGGLPAERRVRLTKLPPALILRGDQDQTVPVREARLLGDWLEAHRSPGEVKIYRGVDHVFARAQGGLDLEALRDAQGRTAAFLERHLQKTAVVDNGQSAVGR
jgi:carboxymethylenebutenolidase